MAWDPIQRLIDTLVAYHTMHERLAQHARPLESWWVFHWFGQPWRAYGYDLTLAEQKTRYVSEKIIQLKRLQFIDDLPTFTHEQTARLRIAERKAALQACLVQVKHIILEILANDAHLTNARNDESNLLYRMFFSSSRGNLYLLLADFGDTLDVELEQEIQKLNNKLYALSPTQPTLSFEDRLQAALDEAPTGSSTATEEPLMANIFTRLRNTWREIRAPHDSEQSDAPPPYENLPKIEPSAPARKF